MSFHSMKPFLRMLGLCIFMLGLRNGVDAFSVPGLELDAYIEVGDINIGVLMPIGTMSPKRLCRTKWLSPERFQLIEATPYVVKQTNRRTDLLPNITLGFVVMDNCHRDITSLGKSMAFLSEGELFC